MIQSRRGIEGRPRAAASRRGLLAGDRSLCNSKSDVGSGGRRWAEAGLPWLSADHPRLGSWDPNQSSAAPLTGKRPGCVGQQQRPGEQGLQNFQVSVASLAIPWPFPVFPWPRPELGWRPNFRLRFENFRVLPCSPEARLLAESGLPMLGKRRPRPCSLCPSGCTARPPPSCCSRRLPAPFSVEVPPTTHGHRSRMGVGVWCFARRRLVSSRSACPVLLLALHPCLLACTPPLAVQACLPHRSELVHQRRPLVRSFIRPAFLAWSLCLLPPPLPPTHSWIPVHHTPDAATCPAHLPNIRCLSFPPLFPPSAPPVVIATRLVRHAGQPPTRPPRHLALIILALIRVIGPPLFDSAGPTSISFPPSRAITRFGAIWQDRFLFLRPFDFPPTP